MALKLPPFFSALPWWAWLVGAGAFGVGVFGGLGGAAAMTPPNPGGAPPQGGPPPGAPPVLKLGSAGPLAPWVRYLQKLLKLPETGTFDAQLRAAVVTYQKSKGLEADGVVGKNTWTALGVTGAAAPAPSPGGGGGGSAPPSPPPGEFLGTGVEGLSLSTNVKEREAQILTEVAAGRVSHHWVPLTWTAHGHTATVLVSSRALALWDGENRLMVSVSFNLAQKIADLLGGAMLTTRMADEIWRQAEIKLTPTNQPWNTDKPVTGSNTDRMIEQSEIVNNKVLAKMGFDAKALVVNEGKDWVLTRRFWNFPEGINSSTAPHGAPGSPHNSANFGLYGAGNSKSPGGEQVIQSIGLIHERPFVDYSQLAKFWKPDSLTIDGVTRNAVEVLADPELSKVLQDEGGTLPGIKHPDLEGVA